MSSWQDQVVIGSIGPLSEVKSERAKAELLRWMEAKTVSIEWGPGREYWNSLIRLNGEVICVHELVLSLGWGQMGFSLRIETRHFAVDCRILERTFSPDGTIETFMVGAQAIRQILARPDHIRDAFDIPPLEDSNAQ